MSWAEVKMAVKSIQRGYANVTSSDVTITLPKAVDPTRCIVLLDGFCGMYSYNSSSISRATATNAKNASNELFATLKDYGTNVWFRSGGDYNDSDGARILFPYATISTYSAARKPYVKALTETQLTIGQSGTYSSGNNGTTVSYQVIEFFN